MTLKLILAAALGVAAGGAAVQAWHVAHAPAIVIEPAAIEPQVYVVPPEMPAAPSAPSRLPDFSSRTYRELRLDVPRM